MVEARKVTYKLSPSDFSFLYEGCQRCYYLKVLYKIFPPSIPLPSVFSRIAGLLKNHYNGKRTDELHPELPPGVVRYAERNVKSERIRLPGYNATCFISGRFDIVVEFDDGTYGLIDFKTGNPESEHRDLYSRQLHAYAYALEHPAQGALSLSPISKMGLLYFNPSRVDQPEQNWLYYCAEVRWVGVDIDENAFIEFIGRVLQLLESSNIPPSSTTCKWCKYITELRSKALI